MNTLPVENWWQIALNLPIHDLFSLCSTDRMLASICRDERFWRERILLEHPDLVIPSRYNAKQFYYNLYTGKSRIVPVYYKDKRLGYVSLNPDTLARLIADILKLYGKRDEVGIYFEGMTFGINTRTNYGFVYPDYVDTPIQVTPGWTNNIYENATAIVITDDPNVMAELAMFRCRYCGSVDFIQRQIRFADEAPSLYCLHCRRMLL